MPTDDIEVQGLVAVSPEALFDAWLDPTGHGALSGGAATLEGKRFTAWDGYISGETLDSERPTRIVQSWRTLEFPEDADDSRLELRLEAVEGGTRLTFLHTGIPQGQGASYKGGWVDHYLEPMKAWAAGLKA